MADPSTSRVGGGIFISYRRQETASHANFLAYVLILGLRAERASASHPVFMDVDSIEPGMDFAQAIRQAVDSSSVLVVLIGPGWLTVTNERGRRIDDPEDMVRLEVEAALACGIRVIPVFSRRGHHASSSRPAPEFGKAGAAPGGQSQS